MRYYDEMPVGTVLETASYTFTKEAILAFAREYDPQPFHLDPAAARDSVFRTLVASGWHTASVAMKLLVESGRFETGMVGLGVDELRWPRPVYPGDTVRVRSEAVGVKPSRSGNRAVVRWSMSMSNQRGEVVLTWSSLQLVPGRPRETTKVDSP
ncbi:MAG: MaoC family dehydratase [Candidatus Eremiobacteraeota bacterium]|nr:MaoC family dehydratase [Candidatus Eremiobacteraeota bacterium]